MTAAQLAACVVTGAVSAFAVVSFRVGLFVRPVAGSYSNAAKLRIVQFWRLKAIFASFFGVAWTLCCFLYVLQLFLGRGSAEYNHATLCVVVLDLLGIGTFNGVRIGVRQGRGPICRFLQVLCPCVYDPLPIRTRIEKKRAAALRKHMLRRAIREERKRRLPAEPDGQTDAQPGVRPASQPATLGLLPVHESLQPVVQSGG